MSDQEVQLAGNENQAQAEGVVEQTSRRGRHRRRASANELSVNMDELRELIQLIRENEFTEFELEREGFRVRVRRGADTYETGASGAGSSRELAGSGQGGPTLSAGESKVISGPVHPGARAET